MKRLRCVLIILAIASINISFAQSYLLNNELPTLTIVGTSTHNDWEIKANSINGFANLTFNDKILKSISILDVHVHIAKLQSGNQAMDKSTETALSENHATTVPLMIKVTTITSNTLDSYAIMANGRVKHNLKC